MKNKFALDFIVQATHGELKTQGPEGVQRIETDSRRPLKGALFVALKGENFDGHQFVSAAIESGADAILTHQWDEKYLQHQGKVAIVLVSDTLRALQDLAQAWRRECGFKVVGITGSNGKTTTKELASQILKEEFRVSASPGSFNNHWGVPLSLLQAEANTEVVLQEMGMNHSGEIRRLCEIATPDVTLVTMVGRAHIGELGSIEAIQMAKNEIYESTPNGIHIYNLDNEFTLELYEREGVKGFPKDRQITFSSFNPEADVLLRAGTLMKSGLQISGRLKDFEVDFKVRAFGRQVVSNLSAAASIGLALGLTPEVLVKHLKDLKFESWGRNQWIPLATGSAVIFDGYNANPESMRMLLKNLFELETEGKKYFIFSDMKELGEWGDDAHQEAAELAGQIGLSKIWYFGSHMGAVKAGLKNSGFHGEAVFSNDFDPKIAQQIQAELSSGDVVALKA
ncbi:MAG TPA: UDP-N-acetylmuramoylalanyl-D-glutamyl-2, 6-diaminopimelate--D-alanyl-D-alanine ligase, partial [Bdellovibrionales bacterium]|nr:UDP-N-acetylmuramoylalanyl-D-glutamyl-2, 6-diaminopimelate--D-alanyl-D-alanine ligase [Bdellovibrionales bacterium]